jgi:hypothetical protein
MFCPFHEKQLKSSKAQKLKSWCGKRLAVLPGKTHTIHQVDKVE